MDNQNDWQSPPAATIYDPEDIAKNKGISMAAYLGILFFLPLFFQRHFLPPSTAAFTASSAPLYIPCAALLLI